MTRAEQIVAAARDIFIMTGSKPSQVRVARFLRVSPGVVKQTVHRLRNRGDREIDALLEHEVKPGVRGYFYEQRIVAGRRPYLSKRVRDGLRLMLAQHAPTDGTLEAFKYIEALVEWREPSPALEIEQRSRRS